MITRDKVLDLVKERGPIIPSDLTSELREDTMIIGAFLSELISAKEIKISNAKVGGSPAYYIETQKAELENKLYKHLNEKNRRTFDHLKNNDILQDEAETPLTRTSLRAIPDFASPFKVTYKGKQHLFWRYYLTSDDIVKTKVKAVLEKLYPEDKKEEAPKEEIKPEPKGEEVPKGVEPSNTLTPIEIPEEKAPEKQPEPEPKKELQETKIEEKPKEIVHEEAQTTLEKPEDIPETKPDDEFLNQVEDVNPSPMG